MEIAVLLVVPLDTVSEVTWHTIISSNVWSEMEGDTAIAVGPKTRIAIGVFVIQIIIQGSEKFGKIKKKIEKSF